MPTKRVGTIALFIFLTILLSACGSAARDASQTVTYTVGGVVKGLAGAGLELRNNINGDSLVLAPPTAPGDDVSFVFDNQVENGAHFDVAVHAQPHGGDGAENVGRWQTCEITQGSGQIANGDEHGIVVTCKNNSYVLSGTVSGLDASSTGVEIKYVSGEQTDSLIILASGKFSFKRLLDSGEPYTIEVVTQPTTPMQQCDINNEHGSVKGATIDNIGVVCSKNSYKVLGSVSVPPGNTGDGLRFSINNQVPNFTSPSQFEFPTAVPSGKKIDVVIDTSPRYQTCTAMPASGTVGGEDYHIAIRCEMTPHRVGGTVHGLEGGGLKLNNERYDGTTRSNNSIAVNPAPATQPLGSDVHFVFDQAVPSLSLYTVSVAQQPTQPWQTCSVRGLTGSGKIAESDIGNVEVDCQINTVNVSGTVSGLVGTLKLTNNGGNEISVTANGGFTFAAPVRSGGRYDVAVSAQPRYVAGATVPSGLNQTCEVQKNPSGVSTGFGFAQNADITGVLINCKTNTFSLGGTLSGLAEGKSVEVNNTEKKLLPTDGIFSFDTLVASGTSYNVTATAPDTQRCDVTGNTGVVKDGPITDINVTCSYLVSGKVSGLAANGVLKLKNGNEVVTTSGGVFKFVGGVAKNAGYDVTVDNQPSGQRCTVANGKGTASGSGIPSITVNCGYVLGGTVSGLATGSKLTLKLGTEILDVTGNTFAFATALADQATYTVTGTDPDGQKCTYSNLIGKVGSGLSPSIAITCAYLIRGTVTNLALNQVGAKVLLKNGVDQKTVTLNGAFTFDVPVEAGLVNGYDVKIAADPSDQRCRVINGSGSTTGAIVTNVQVDCEYLISGQIVSLDPTMTIKLTNGSEPLSMTGNGRFQFPTPVANKGSYNVKVSLLPAGRECLVTNGSGVVKDKTITDILVNCATMKLLAGDMAGCGSINGDISIASFCSSEGFATDANGDLLMADLGNYVIRKITQAGVVSTYAGVVDSYGALDGPRLSATFGMPIAMAYNPTGDLFIVQRVPTQIRRIDTNGMVTTLMLAGTNPPQPVDIPSIRGVVIDASGALYVSTSSDNTIKKITLDAQQLATVTNYVDASVGLKFPSGIAFDSTGNLFIADSNNSVVRKVTPGGVVSIFAGQLNSGGPLDGVGTGAQFSGVNTMTIDRYDNLYVTDGYTIRKISPTASVSTFAGMANTSGWVDAKGTAARFMYPNGIIVHGDGFIYVNDAGTIRKIDSSGLVNTFSGAPLQNGYVDAQGSAARFNFPSGGISADGAGNVYVSDGNNFRIRKITSTGVVTTYAGSGGGGTQNGPALSATFGQMAGSVFDPKGNLYVADSTYHMIRMISATGNVTTVAGSGTPGIADGGPTVAQFNSPRGLTGVVDFFGDFNLYVADSSNATIRKITPNGVVSTVAGKAGVRGARDGIGIQAEFQYPQDIVADASENLYVADSGNCAVRKVDRFGTVTTLAGMLGVCAYVDGLKADARLNYVNTLAISPSGDIFVADSHAHVLRKIDALGNVSTVIGTPGVSGFLTGVPGVLAYPERMTIQGNKLYFTQFNGVAVVLGIP